MEGYALTQAQCPAESRIGEHHATSHEASSEKAALLQSLRGSSMPIVDIDKLRVLERLPGWQGRYFHTANMTFAHYDFSRGSSIHEHFHEEEEVYEVVEGELEVTIDGMTQVAKPGLVAVVPSNVRHSVKALTDGRLIVVDYPARPDFG
jgi:quercetin dioxygenase-like cupin family protein